MSPAVTGRPDLRPVRSLPLVLTPDTSTPSRSLTSQNSTLSSERSAAGTGAVYEDVEEAKGEQVEQGEDDKLPLMARYDKSLKPLPWIKAPVTGSEWIWVKAKDEAPEWLSLLFDLVVVAVMTTFSLASPLITSALMNSNTPCRHLATYPYFSRSLSLSFGHGSAKPPTTYDTKPTTS